MSDQFSADYAARQILETVEAMERHANNLPPVLHEQACAMMDEVGTMCHHRLQYILVIMAHGIAMKDGADPIMVAALVRTVQLLGMLDSGLPPCNHETVPSRLVSRRDAPDPTPDVPPPPLRPKDKGVN